MQIASLALPAALLVSFTSLALFIVVDWRWNTVLLAVQYVGVFALVATQWPPAMAVTKLIAGWMAGAVLGLAINSTPELNQALRPAPPASGRRLSAWRYVSVGHSFYLLAAVLVALAAFSRLERLPQWIPGLGKEAAWAGLILVGMGLLKLGFTTNPYQVILGLLVSLSGFEILYAAAQSSLLVAGLLSGVTLALALVGAYLLVAPSMEETG
ncbi:MAG: hypothetical protein AB1894_04005 [Chloroflexota bacterium]